MAREKTNLDFFLFDCRLDLSFELIEAQHGLIGFAVVVKLLQEIYGGERGYYLEYTNDFELMFCKKNQIDADNLKSIVASSVERGIFDKNLFTIFNVLTSEKIQRRYFDAVARRKGISVIAEYLLVQVGEIPSNVDIKRENVNIKVENVDILRQKRKDKIREDNIKESKKEKSKRAIWQQAEECFERLWEQYPMKRGYADISLKQKVVLFQIGEEELMRCIERYKKELGVQSWRQAKNGSTFFIRGYEDYLDKRYEELPAPTPIQQPRNNKFQSFPQRDYDTHKMSDLEKALLKQG